PLHRDLVARAGREDSPEDRAGAVSRAGVLKGEGMAGPIRVAVVGCGHWGPNHVRAFSTLGSAGARMLVAADRDEERRRHVADLYPSVRLEAEAEAVLEDPEVDAVVIATPVPTHYPFARKALAAGKHVL